MGYTTAQKRAYWIRKKQEDERRSKNRKPFQPLTNPSQYQAAVFKDIAEGSGDTIIEAVAGSGKTTTLLNGLTYVPPGKTVCFCAFGHDIAEELKDRCPVAGIEIATTHSFGMRAVKRRFKGAVLDKNKVQQLTISLVGDPNADPENIDEEKQEMIDYISRCVSLCKQRLALDPDAVSETMDYHNLDFLTEEERKKALPEEELEIRRNDFIKTCLNVIELCKSNVITIDFDDMIFLPVILNLPIDQFDVVFADEVQDFNHCQMELIKRMRKPGGRIIACGDRRQAIFLFRAADENSIPNLIEGLGAKTLPLSITYRCAKNVVEYAKKTVQGLEHLQAADNAEDGEVVDATFDDLFKNAKAGDFIVSRLNAPNMQLAMYLLANNIRCNIRGKDLGNYFKYFIKRSKCKTLPQFIDFVNQWRDNQIELLTERKKKPTNIQAAIENIQDRSTCMLVLAENCFDLKQMLNKINELFADEMEETLIILGTCHKLKGAERDRVWLLKSTFKSDSGIEEDNLLYVAATRAKKNLYVVQGKFREKK